MKFNMGVLYTIGIFLLRTIYAMAAWFNPKAKIFQRGRAEQRQQLRSTFPLPAQEQLVWVHCASLGEFEQGRPIIEALKTWKPSIKILLTFFSPSGYEVRKNYEYADFVFYLPWDTKANAKWFAETVRPAMAVFIKYEFWYHYSTQLARQKIPLLSVSSIFRETQIFFKPYGSLFRDLLKCFTHFFVQNQRSVDLLRSLGISAVTLAGDTRFDRVNQIIRQGANVPFVDQFKNGKQIMVAGSVWEEDMEVLAPLIHERKGEIKFIIAPHEITEEFLSRIEKLISGKTVRYSRATEASVGDAEILVIDNIGMLSKLYQYGSFAFVGGAYKQGLHNILEAACCGIPIFFGDNAYQVYQEAVDLVLRGGAFDVHDYTDLKQKFEKMMLHPDAYQLAAEVTRQYVQENLGATEKIMVYCKKYLS